MSERNLPTEVAHALEAGFNKHLNRSIIFSPFRLFFNLFKKSNPKIMDKVREVIRSDIAQLLGGLENFSEAIFIVKQNQITPAGKEFLTRCYNIGIRLLKKDLTVMMAFKAIRDAELRDQIYGHILEQIQNSAFELLNKNLTKTTKTLPEDNVSTEL